MMWFCFQRCVVHELETYLSNYCEQFFSLIFLKGKDNHSPAQSKQCVFLRLLASNLCRLAEALNSALYFLITKLDKCAVDCEWNNGISLTYKN